MAITEPLHYRLCKTGKSGCDATCTHQYLTDEEVAKQINDGPFPYAFLYGVLKEVREERLRQTIKWGQQNCTDFEWISILTEEVGEAAKEANDLNFRQIDDETALPRLRRELIQIAAVAVAHVEAIDRRSEP